MCSLSVCVGVGVYIMGEYVREHATVLVLRQSGESKVEQHPPSFPHKLACVRFGVCWCKWVCARVYARIIVP